MKPGKHSNKTRKKNRRKKRSTTNRSLFGVELDRHRIDAIAQTGRLRTIIKHMPQMSPTATARHFGTNHAVAAIALFLDTLRIGRLIKTRPATTGVEFGIGFK